MSARVPILDGSDKLPEAHLPDRLTVANLAETIRDVIGAAVAGSGVITVTPNDAGDSITISTTATANASDAALRDRATHTGTQSSTTISDFTEAAQDAVAAMLTSGANVTLTYNDAGNQLTVTAAGGDAETMRDTIGAALVGINGVSIAVNDAADTITFSVSGLTIAQTTGLQTALDSKITKTSGGFVPLSATVRGDTITVRKDPTTGFWPASWDADGRPVYTGGSASAGARPTSSSDITVFWKGWEPFPPTVASGAGGVLNNVDVKISHQAP